MKRILIATLVLVGACRNNDDTALPPLETLYLPGPEAADTANALTAASALCTDGDSYDRLNQWITDHNELLQDKIALWRALGAATRRALRRDGEFEWSRTRNDRTLTLEAKVEDDDSVTFSGTFEGPNVEKFTFLSGVTAADRKSGEWTIYRPGGDEAIHVTWQRDGNDLHVEREVVGTDRQVVYDRTGTTASVDFTGVDHTAHAEWDTETKNGSFTVDGEDRGCFQFASGEFCGAECPAE